MDLIRPKRRRRAAPLCDRTNMSIMDVKIPPLRSATRKPPAEASAGAATPAKGNHSLRPRKIFDYKALLSDRSTSQSPNSSFNYNASLAGHEKPGDVYEFAPESPDQLDELSTSSASNSSMRREMLAIRRQRKRGTAAKRVGRKRPARAVQPFICKPPAVQEAQPKAQPLLDAGSHTPQAKASHVAVLPEAQPLPDTDTHTPQAKASHVAVLLEAQPLPDADTHTPPAKASHVAVLPEAQPLPVADIRTPPSKASRIEVMSDVAMASPKPACSTPWRLQTSGLTLASISSSKDSSLPSYSQDMVLHSRQEAVKHVLNVAPASPVAGPSSPPRRQTSIMDYLAAQPGHSGYDSLFDLSPLRRTPMRMLDGNKQSTPEKRAPPDDDFEPFFGFDELDDGEDLLSSEKENIYQRIIQPRGRKSPSKGALRVRRKLAPKEAPLQETPPKEASPKEAPLQETPLQEAPLKDSPPKEKYSPKQPAGLELGAAEGSQGEDAAKELENAGERPPEGAEGDRLESEPQTSADLEVKLFEDLESSDNPKPLRNYSAKKRKKQSPTQECSFERNPDADGEIIKKTKIRKEKPNKELEDWAKSFNEMCKEVDEQPLYVE